MCCKLWINYYPLKTHYNIVQNEHKYQWNVYKGSNSDVSWYLAYIWGSKVMQYTSVIVKQATDFMVLFKALIIIWNVPVSYRFILHDRPESPKFDQLLDDDCSRLLLDRTSATTTILEPSTTSSEQQFQSLQHHLDPCMIPTRYILDQPS